MATVTRAQAMRNAGAVLAAARAHMATLTPEQAAQEAYVPGGPTVEELAQRIRDLRAASSKTTAA